MTSFVRRVLTFCFLLCLAGVAFSQSRNTGEIRGTVSAAGAVVPGATVTLTNVDTGEKKDFLTNQDGIYDTVSTPAGNYKISFSAMGFKTLVRGPFALQVDVISEDASLEVGATSETITVTAEGTPLLETETSQQGAVLDEKTVNQLPQIGAGITGNDWANFNVLLPGAEGTASGSGGGEGSGNYNAGDAVSINGNLPNYANYLQDGAVVQLPVSNNVDNLVFEAVQEVQITTSSFSAQYGIGGAVFNQISKSGSNGFHGSAYEFWQNNILNAHPYFQTELPLHSRCRICGTTSGAAPSVVRSSRTSCSSTLSETGSITLADPLLLTRARCPRRRRRRVISPRLVFPQSMIP